MFATLFDVEFTNVYFILKFHSFLNLFLYGILSHYKQMNLRVVETTIMEGTGHAGCVPMSNAMNLPEFEQKSYNCQAKFLNENMKIFLVESHLRIVIFFKVAYEKILEPEQVSLHKIFLDISVSFDGTWMCCGHASHIGACIVINCKTRTVIDFVILC